MIRPLQEKDLERYLEIAQDSIVLRNADAEKGSVAGVERQFERVLEAMENIYQGSDARYVDALGFVITDKVSGKTIGFATFRRGQPFSYLETTTLLSPEYWGKGLRTEARRTINSFLFEDLGIPGLISVVSEKNIASKKLTENLGFKEMRFVEKRNALDKSSRWIEYRLSNLRTQPQHDAFPDIQKKIIFSKNTLERLQNIFGDQNLPPQSKVSLYYRTMMSDPTLVAALSAEHMSVIAEDLALRSLEQLGPSISASLQNLRNHPKASGHSCRSLFL